MTLLKRLFLLLPVVCLFASCSEDFEVAAPYKPVTLVYGLMNIGDTTHYIRIQKAFLDERKSALDMARVVDSNFYPSLTVHLKEFAGTTMVSDDILPLVDLNKEGYPKDTGVFFNAPSYAYKSKRPLLATNIYRLVIINAATGETDSAETPIISNAKNDFLVFDFNDQKKVAFDAPNGTEKFNLDVRVPANSKIFEGIVRFHWKNKMAADSTIDSVDWHFATATWDGSSTGVSLFESQRAILPFLKAAIGPAPAGVDRYIGKCDLFVWAGSPDLANYQLINNAQGGITADQIKPLYTNIKGKNTIGIFTTRTRVEFHNVPITDASLDSLRSSANTVSLNFKDRY